MDENIRKLNQEFGFGYVESKLALEDTDGNIELSIDRLLKGCYAPPPYDERGDGHFDTSSSLLEKKSRQTSTTVRKTGTLDINFTNLCENQCSTSEKAFEDQSLPPPYEKVLKEDSLKKWEKDSEVMFLNLNEQFDKLEVKKRNTRPTRSGLFDERCSSCFNELQNQEIAEHINKFYHKECFRKKFGPKCSYCFMLLSEPDLDHELSGQYLIYDGKNYHVECYEKYAGPRCTYCFNVIIERPNGDFSGRWVRDGIKEFHMECYEKKKQALWHARNS